MDDVAVLLMVTGHFTGTHREGYNVVEGVRGRLSEQSVEN